MKSFTSFLLLSFTFLISTVFSSTKTLPPPTSSWKDVRDQFAFDRETKWDCFYRTTTPVKNMDPSIWREDQYGNLMMAGLNFNCKGCLCYTFDHRYPISKIGTNKADPDVVDLMSSHDNCQAISFRTNILKGSNEDTDLRYVIDRFGCDTKTMRLFTDKNYAGALAVQNYLLSEERVEQLHKYYIRYVTGPNFLDPRDIGKTKKDYFKYLNKASDLVTRKVFNFLNQILI